MSFNDPIATAIVEIEPVLNTQAFTDAANQGAQNFNNRLNQAMQRFGQTGQNAINNVTAGFQNLGTLIANRLPVQVAASANVIAQRFGQAFGNIQAGIGRLNSSFGSAFKSIGTAAGGAAVGLTALVGVAVKITQSFAGIADAFRGAELSLTAAVNASDNAGISAQTLIGNLRELGATLGVSSVELSRSATQLITLGISGEQTTRILTALSTAGARVGATSAQTGRALDGLTQIVSKGSLQMEELRRQILGNLPGALNMRRVFELLAEDIGVTVEAVQQMQKNGQITADQAIPAITQAIEELNGGVDVLGIRMSTLSGLTAVLRENFNQVVGTSFQGFIEGILPVFRTFIEQFKTGTGPFVGFQENVERLGSSMAETLAPILQRVIPLIPRLFDLFVDATEAVGPLVVDLVDLGATILNIVIPVSNALIKVIDVILNRIPILSDVFRALAVGAITGGVVKAVGVLGRALGSFGGLVGRVATPLSKLAQGFAELAPLVAKIATSIALFRGPLEGIITLIDAALGKVADLLDKIGNIPGIKQAVDAIAAVSGAIGDAFAKDNAETPVNKATGSLGSYFKTLGQTAASIQSLSGLNDILKSVVESTDKLEQAQKKVDQAQKAHRDAIQGEKDARKAVTDAIQRQTEAQERLDEITAKLTDKEAERQKLLNDTVSDLREIAEAQRDVEKSGLKLLDIDAERADILEKIKELSSPATADEITSADNKVARATIALNKAKREEQELLDEINKSQQTSVDLSGLTLDQLRTRLGGIRLSLAAQRSITGGGKTQEEIQEDINIAHLDTVDAQIALNEAIEARDALDRKVIENQAEIESQNRRLRQLEIDKADAIQDQSEAQDALNLLQGGQTTRAAELKKVEEDIKGLKIDQKNATVDVRNATDDIKTKQDAIKIAVQETRDAQREVKTALSDQKILTGDVLGNEKDINSALSDRIELNNRLSSQNIDVLTNAFKTNLSTLFKDSPALDTILQSPQLPRQLAETLLSGGPNALKELLRALGAKGFEQGGMITKPQIAVSGEKYKHEMILPLTKPNRVWEIMSQNLPRYPGALAAAQNAISGGSGRSQAKAVNLGSKVVVPRSEGPATYGQIEELIQVLREQRTEVHVDAPITVEKGGSDQLLLKRLSRQLKREILDELGRR